MGTSAPVPPDEGFAPDVGEDPEEHELTSIMNAEQRQELLQAARTAAKEHEQERDTVPPPPEARTAIADEVSIPRAPAMPSEVLQTPLPVPAAPVAKVLTAAPAPSTPPSASTTWPVVAFVLLAAAIVFELR